MGCDSVRRGRQNRIRTGVTADQDPQLQLDALSAANCLKTYTDTGTKADRPQWNACLADLRRGDTLIIWKIDRLGRNLRDLTAGRFSRGNLAIRAGASWCSTASGGV